MNKSPKVHPITGMCPSSKMSGKSISLKNGIRLMHNSESRKLDIKNIILGKNINRINKTNKINKTVKINKINKIRIILQIKETPQIKNYKLFINH
jgi:hypothetical protein